MEPGTPTIDATNWRAIGFKIMERIEKLSQDIGLLSAHLNAANCRMLELIAEFDELSGWSDQGAAFIKALDACRETVGQDVSAVTSDDPPKLDEKANPDIAKENMDYCTPNDKLYRSQVDALVLIDESYLAHGLQSAPGGDKYQLLLTVDQTLLDNPQQSGNCSLSNGQSLPLETLKLIGCEASIRTVIRDTSGEPINIGRKSRTIPNPMRLALLKRDAGCRFPSCDQQRYIHGHHIKHWAAGGETSLHNLVMLCHHHHRLVHEKGFGVARRGPNRFTFKSPSGNVVHDTAPAVAAVNDLDGSIRYWDKKMDISYDSQTAATKWRGERMDYSWAVVDLALRDGRQAVVVRMT